MTRRPLRLAPEWAVGIVYLAGMFMSIMDSTIVNVALPTMAKDFRVPIASIEWVVVGYLVSLAVWIPASGWIGDRIGTKRTFLFALAAFTTASILCGLAPNLGWLTLFRVLQGVGGGMLQPVGTAMLFRAFPPQRRAQAAGILIVPTTIAPAVGPIVGGFLVSNLSWRWIFYVNVPIGIAAFAFAVLAIEEHREALPGRFDWPGFVLSALGLSLMLYALTQGPSSGWSSPVTVTAAVTGALCLALLVRVELRRREPLLNLRLLGDRLFGRANLASFFGYASYTGMLFLVPLYLQQGLGASPLESGVTTFPEALGIMLASRLSSRLYGRFGPRRLIAGGLFGTTSVMILVATIDPGRDFWPIRFAMFALGCGMAFVFLPLNAATFANVSHADTGRASAIFNTLRRVAAAGGVALLATVLVSFAPLLHGGPGPGTSLTPGFRVAFFADAALAFIGALSALTIHDADAAVTMHLRGYT
jgi:EmrB/QacA subfamily drug resistance transporter